MRSENIMNERTDKFPRWVWIYSILVMVFIPLALGLVTVISPESMPFDLSGGGAQAYGIRNITAGLATIFALYRLSRSMMLVMFVMRLLTDIGDYVGTLGQDGFNMGFLVMMTIVFWTGAIFGIRAFWSAKDIEYSD